MIFILLHHFLMPLPFHIYIILLLVPFPFLLLMICPHPFSLHCRHFHPPSFQSCNQCCSTTHHSPHPPVFIEHCLPIEERCQTHLKCSSWSFTESREISLLICRNLGNKQMKIDVFPDFFFRQQ